MGNLDRAVEAIRKKYGEHSIVTLGAAKGIVVKKFSTGSLSLDFETGGGFPRGRIAENIGEASASKTTESIAAAAEYLAIDKDHSAALVDVENAIDPEWAIEAIGAEYADRIYILNAESGEQAGNKIKDLVYSRSPVLVIADSVASMTPDKEIEEEFEKGLMGTHARFINRLMRVISAGMWKNLASGSNDCASVILLNQTREKMTCVGPDTKVTWKYT